MKFHISSPEQIGPLVRASRKAMQLRQDDAAGSIGVSENFLGKVERGSDSVQWGKLFQVMQELGLTLSVEVPEPFAEQVQARLNELHARAASAGSKAD
ncbi:transcriptional regulator [Halopseudomonas pachastrellae]|uniref:Transcriptional regulator n=1 Tax=Halopseudomonas pachastrellae TaxID=254161 RepID=A0A1S8DK40_9GAMM|nr:helix-turn-helix domain-containing protein [Halopseudomonas pachastrellae]ONM45704.1 transcriptional regulator [Halopseudomonas pachastrellae]SFM21832.1 Helix-turn-helix domain-containing protein [Halopseudomonas pachastrellae]HIQ54161.1 transcriptional regulator [Halopseudomonas pachastrellae]|tara:strand:+ start:380 stop:673 length:294 start_codon:yes stop_codon:yes gene_type:complete